MDSEQRLNDDEMDICTTPPHDSAVQFDQVLPVAVARAVPQPPLPGGTIVASGGCAFDSIAGAAAAPPPPPLPQEIELAKPPLPPQSPPTLPTPPPPPVEMVVPRVTLALATTMGPVICDWDGAGGSPAIVVRIRGSN